MCGKDIYFNRKDSKNSICFDHRKGGIEPIKKSPHIWLREKIRTPEREKIWIECDFGMLCSQCNIKLPTENRKQFKENINRYIQ